MKSLRLLACAGIILISLPVSAAAGTDDLIKALVPTDPRSRLESATGMVYGSIYSPRKEEAQSESEATELPAESRPGGGRFGDLYKGLRSSLYQPLDQAGKDASTSVDHVEDDPFSTSVSPIPLGKPEQRDGVWYEDDLRHRHR